MPIIMIMEGTRPNAADYGGHTPLGWGALHNYNYQHSPPAIASFFQNRKPNMP